MSFLEILLTAFSLSLDAVAVAIAAGALRHITLRQALTISLFFGGFQLVMPLIGWVAGLGFKSYFLQYGHIIGFVALFVLGSKMLHESLKKPDKEDIQNEINITQIKVLTTLALFTSIDALVVGITFNFISVNIPVAVVTIGLATFLLCLLGVYVGTRIRHLIGNKIEIVGALVLIALAFKILLY